ncbi:MAG: sigma-70 family RNA polymerase sigma factor [Pseudomonadota bacterium]
MNLASEAQHQHLPLPELEDSALLEKIAKQQSRDALAVLYERYRLSVSSFLRRKLIAEKLVEEIYNDVMYTVWSRASEFRHDSKVSTWIYGIAYRHCMAQSRKETRHSRQRATLDFDQEIDPATSSAKFELQQLLQKAIAGLSEEHRTVIELAYFYGHNIEDISKIVDCPTNTVKTRLYHARQKLKTLIRTQNPTVNTVSLGGS